MTIMIMERGVEVGGEREPVSPLKSQEMILLLKRQELRKPTNIPPNPPQVMLTIQKRSLNSTTS